MLTGYVSPEREALVSLRLRAADGAELDVEVILDTGFTDFLTLPLSVVRALNLPRRDTVQIRLADGTLKMAEVYEGRVYWDSVWRAVPIQASKSDPLIGMSLLYETLVSLEVVEGGNVTIEPIE